MEWHYSLHGPYYMVNLFYDYSYHIMLITVTSIFSSKMYINVWFQ